MKPSLSRYKDAKYLKWIRQQPCCVSGRQGVDASHTWGMGGKTRRNDYVALPLTHELHMKLHGIGIKTFEDRYAVDFKDQIIGHLSKYISESTGE